MRDTEKRYSVLFKQAGFIDDAHWDDFIKKQFKGKGLVDVLKQDVSLGSFRDLMLLQIKVPFTGEGSHGDHHLSEVLSAPILSNREVTHILEKNERDLYNLVDLLIKEKLLKASEAETYHRKDWKTIPNIYEQIVNDGIVNPTILEKLAGIGENKYAKHNRLTHVLNVLVFNKEIQWEDISNVLDEVGDNLDKVPSLLYSNKVYSQTKLLKAISKDFHFPSAPFKDALFNKNVIELFPAEFLRRNMIIPHTVKGGELTIFTSDPLNLGLFDSISIMTDLYVSPFFAPQGEIIRKLHELTEDEVPATSSNSITSQTAAEAAPPAPLVQTERDFKIEGMTSSADQGSTVALVTSIVEGAVERGATDIHIEPEQDYVRVRYRIDGVLHKITEYPLEMHLSVTSRVKVLANMNVTERRRPQDGHFSFDLDNRHYYFRISSMPTNMGEKIVIRVLDESRVLKGLGDLGFEKVQYDLLTKIIEKPYGLILVTGPTGSGKTSTLYTCMTALNDEHLNLITIEDPIEYSLEGINQVQVERNIDLNFADGLRATLRQDPDVIMVGEVRDPETAHIAVRAALTGHLVFSTLHTNTSSGAISALSNMGVQTFPLANGLSAVISQRLVRRICEKCATKYKPDKGMLEELGFDTAKFKKQFTRGKGCNACFQTGYKGRVGIYEILDVNRDVRAAITEEKSDVDIYDIAFSSKDAITLINAGRLKVESGITTADEVLDAVLV